MTRFSGSKFLLPGCAIFGKKNKKKKKNDNLENMLYKSKMFVNIEKHLFTYS